jgi:nucleolar protein 58
MPSSHHDKMARMVATKAALSIRLDALADADSKSSLDSATIGIENRAKLETRLRLLEQGMGHTSLRSIAKASGSGGQKKFEMSGNGATYNDAADTLVPTAVKVVAKMEVDEDEEEANPKKEKKSKKSKGGDEDDEDEVRFSSFASFHLAH